MQKWYPTSDQHGLQKGPRKWAKITKMASKSHPKTVFKKNIDKLQFPAPLNVAKVCKGQQNWWFLCSGLGSLLGLILEVFWEPKWRPKPSKRHFKKTSKKWCPKWPQTGPKGGPKMEPKSSKMRSWKHLVSRVAPKWPPDPLQDRFWRGFGTILGPCSSVFLTYVWWFWYTFFSSMLPTTTFKIIMNHQKNAAESFPETDILLVQSCIEQFNSKR